MTDRTISEKLFEQFCTETNIPYVRLEPDSASGKTPDYELRLQDPPILVEIKQIDLNKEDKAVTKELLRALETSNTVSTASLAKGCAKGSRKRVINSGHGCDKISLRWLSSTTT